MEDGSSKARTAEQIDFPILWVVVRGAQILLVVIYAKFAYLSLGTDAFVSGLISSIGLLLIFGALAHGLVTGTVDSSGIRYRRYFRHKTVSWADVSEIQWVRSRLKVFIRGRGKRRKKLVFLLNPLKAEGAYWAHRLGREVSPPEILERIHALPIETPPTIASAPPYAGWYLRLILAIGILFVLIVLWSLLSAHGPVSH
jgi:hypothetical protein